MMAENLEVALADSLKKMKDTEAKERLLQNITADIAQMRDGSAPEDILKYASFSKNQPATLGAYFPQEGLLVFDEIGRITEVLEALEVEEEQWFASLLEEGKIVHSAKLSFSFSDLKKQLNQQKLYLSLFIRTTPGIVVKKTITVSCKPMQQFHGQMHLLKNEMDRWQEGRYRVFLIADGTERMQKVQSILKDYDMEADLSESSSSSGRVQIIDGDLSAGFELPLQRIAVITDAELFKGKAKRRAR
ncbi:hypothetical protein J4G37_39295, partial [Microvirga sp. 3-52]|nr:hypothetical protein [Microvirga sp. 3-52]